MKGTSCVPGALHEFRKERYGKRSGQSGGKLPTSFPVSTHVLCAIAVGHHKGTSSLLVNGRPVVGSDKRRLPAVVELDASLLTERGNLAAVRVVSESLAAPSGDAGWSARWIDFDDEFHTTIARVSGLPRLAEDIGRYRLLHRGLNQTLTEPASLQQALAEHLEILDALETRDAQPAREALDAHMAAWQQYFVEHFPR